MAVDRAAYFEAKLAALHAGLTLTSAQESLWPPLDKAMHDIASLRGSEFQAMMTQRRADSDQNAKGEDQQTSQAAADSAPFDALKETGARLEQHGKALQALADAAQPMFATLSPAQTRRLPMLLRGLVPQRGPIERMMASLGVGPRDETQGMGDRMGSMFSDDQGPDGRGGLYGAERDGGRGEGGHHGPMAGHGQEGARGQADQGQDGDQSGSDQYGDARGPRHHPMDNGHEDRGYGGWNHRAMDGWDRSGGREADRGWADGQRRDRGADTTDRNPSYGDNADQTDGSY